MRMAMYRFKYSNVRSYAKVFTRDAMSSYGKWLRSLDLDGVIAIPMYLPKQRRRGYNQAEVFAKMIARELQVPYYGDYVIRGRNTAPQKNLNDVERKNNLKNAFKIRKSDVKLRKVLLIDDIFTTGSTMNGVAEVLSETGVKEIYCLCICAAKGD